MGRYRRDRINEEMRKELMNIMRNVKDPRVQDAFLSVTAAEVSPDLKYAKILSGDEKEVQQGLKAASGYIRRELARTLNLRITPELSFHRDTSIAYGAHIASILNNLEISEPEEEEGPKDNP